MRRALRTGRITWRGRAGLFTGLVLLLAGPVAQANQSRTWGACECEQDQYTLTVQTLGYGTYTKDPDKQYYTRGETVNVSFTPNEDRRFVEWSCSPASNLASGFPVVTDTSVFITGNTTLTPLTAPATYSLTVYWDPTHGSVEVPEGAEQGQSSGLNWVRGDIPYGEEVTLNATPGAGYFTEWLGYVGSGGLDWSGYRFADSVKVVLLSSDRVLQAAFSSCDDYPDPMYSNTVAVSGGTATVCSAYAPPQSGYGSGCYPELDATGGPANSFSLVVYPYPLHSFTYLNWTAGGTTVYSTGNWLSDTPGNTYTANVVQKIMLNVETEGQGVVTSENFLAFYNPLPYYGGTYYGNPPTPSPGSNAVTMYPDACENWSFDHWEYKDSGGNWVNGGSGNIFDNNAFTIYMNWHTGSGIHVPNGQGAFSVKAVFAMPTICTETVATQPANRDRTTIGVGEQVELSLPGVSSPITWQVSGGGTIDPAGNQAIYTAPDVATQATVTATFCQSSASVTFDVIAPTGLHFANFLGQGMLMNMPPTHPNIALGYYAYVFVEPDLVNFGRIQLFEGASEPVPTDYFTTVSPAPPPHKANGPWAMTGEVVVGKGSRLLAKDTIQYSASTTPYSDGEVTWPNQWRYSVINMAGGPYNIEITDQKVTLTAGDVLKWTQTKDSSGGFITNRDDPLQPHWLGDSL